MSDRKPGVAAFLLPAPEELALARKVNASVGPHARITPYRIEKDEGELGYGMVLEYFEARHVVEQDYPFFDADALVDMVNAFIAELKYRQAEAWEIAR